MHHWTVRKLHWADDSFEPKRTQYSRREYCWHWYLARLDLVTWNGSQFFLLSGGNKLAYRAYNRWAEKNSEQKMPGLAYTAQQLFWISSAQIWCRIGRNETMRNSVLTKTHSPGRFRVIGPMSNLKEFSEDFQCPLGSRMNPVSKCEIW